MECPVFSQRETWNSTRWTLIFKRWTSPNRLLKKLTRHPFWMNLNKLPYHQMPDRLFKKAPFSPSQPRRAETRLSTGKATGALAHGAYTGVREHDKGPICLRETAPADLERRWPVGRSFSEGWRTFSTPAKVPAWQWSPFTVLPNLQQPQI